MSIEAMKQSLEQAYLDGFNDSAEGYNGEYPFRDHGVSPTKDRHWVERRNSSLRQAIEQAQKQDPYLKREVKLLRQEKFELINQRNILQKRIAKLEQAQKQEPVAYDKTELNCFAQDLYDQKMREGKHGHYESMFHVIHQCIKKVIQRQTIEQAQVASSDTSQHRVAETAKQRHEQAEKQEPVAWRHRQFYENQQGWFYCDWHPEGINPTNAELLYTSPPPRQPLTDEVIKLRGEIGVLVGLLGAALQVIETVDGEDADECQMLMELQNKITYAIRGASGIKGDA